MIQLPSSSENPIAAPVPRARAAHVAGLKSQSPVLLVIEERGQRRWQRLATASAAAMRFETQAGLLDQKSRRLRARRTPLALSAAYFTSNARERESEKRHRGCRRYARPPANSALPIGAASWGPGYARWKAKSDPVTGVHHDRRRRRREDTIARGPRLAPGHKHAGRSAYAGIQPRFAAPDAERCAPERNDFPL